MYAQHFAGEWNFFARAARSEKRLPIAQPPLEDWMQLLDGVRRRVGRGLVRPEEVTRVKRSIRERFPEAEL